MVKGYKFKLEKLLEIRTEKEEESKRVEVKNLIKEMKKIDIEFKEDSRQQDIKVIITAEKMDDEVRELIKRISDPFSSGFSVYDEKGAAQESAPHPKQMLYVDFGCDVEEGWILRRKES